MSVRGVGLAAVAALALWCGVSVQAQLLSGAWVDQADAKARETRTSPLRLIVLDTEGKPSEGARVRLTQLDHDFQIGAPASPEALAAIAGGSPVYGQFNAVSLERRTAWPVLQPEAGVAMDALAIDRLVEASSAVVRHVRFGAVVSADTAELPGWVVEAPPGDFAQMVEAHARGVAEAWGGKVVGLDVYADALTHQAVEDRIGVAGVRRLFQAAGFAQPEARLNLRLDDGLTVGRITAVARRVDALTGRLVPIGGLTLTQRVDGVLQQEGVRRSLERAAALGLPVTIAELEVSGASPIAAAVNLETLLRHAFATPGIEGVYFRGVEAGELVSARAALVDGGGEATPAGKVLEGLFGAVWRSRVEARADEVGNVRARVFAGRYLAEVQLPDGTACTARFHVPLSRETVAVVVQPMRHQAEAGVGQRGEAAAPTW